MSTFGFIAHALRLSEISPNSNVKAQTKEAPQTVTGNSYSIFTTKNYEDSEMHWFWMVLIFALLLFAWSKLRRFCKCPGPSKEEKKNKRLVKCNKRQHKEIE